VRIVAEAAAELEAELEWHVGGDVDAAGLLGSLNLHMAIPPPTKARTAPPGDSGTQRTPLPTGYRPGYHHPQTIFGAANVAIHGVSIAADLRRTGEAVARAERINPADVPSRERRGRLFGEIAAGHLHRRELPEALYYLEQAYLTAPEEVPYAPLTRGVAVELVRSATGSLKSDAVALAERIGVLPTT
jgi:hypothetical protein